jgi:hypothetical protein
VARIVDKNATAGPLVEILNPQQQRTTAIVDAVIRGY